MTQKEILDQWIDRRGTNAYKWDVGRDNVLPMWVADMDLPVAPAIREAVERRAAHGAYGYTHVPDAYYESLRGWFNRRHGWDIQPESVIYTTGVVPAISAIIKALTVPGDGVIVQTPVYNCFFSSIRNNGCIAVANPLIYTPGKPYGMDFEGLERAASDPKVTLMLLCNPHNPAGRLWTREELTRVDEICGRHGVTVVSDEIHCELTYRGTRYQPYSPVAQHPCVVCVSPSKAFNTAGLQIANIVADDPELRRRIDRAINANEVCDINPFGVAALMAAYNHSEQWLVGVCDYIYDNYIYVKREIELRMPQLKITPLEATYLMWIDCSETGLTGSEMADRLLELTGLMVSPGDIYGPEGAPFIRLNLACPMSHCREAVKRMEQLVKTLI